MGNRKDQDPSVSLSIIKLFEFVHIQDLCLKSPEISGYKPLKLRDK